MAIIRSLKHYILMLLGKKSTINLQEQVENTTNGHDLGHASKCVWELDKEA